MISKQKHYPYSNEAKIYVEDNNIPEYARHALLDFGEYLEENLIAIPDYVDADAFVVMFLYDRKTSTQGNLRVITHRLYQFVEYCHKNRNTILNGRLTEEKLARYIVTNGAREIIYYDNIFDDENI